MKKIENFILRKIGDAYTMIPVGQTALKFNGFVQANPVSAFIWENIESVDTIEQLVEKVCNKYEVDYQKALNDITHLVNQMKQAGWIE